MHEEVLLLWRTVLGDEMTTDRKLLRLAAKAAGIKVHGLADKFVAQHDMGRDGLCIANDRGGDSLWNPLTDDGDALRLAVKLGLTVSPTGNLDFVFACVATRRAVVRAAAEIGKETPK